MKLSKCCKVEIIKTLSGANICPSCGQPCTEQPEPAEWEKEIYRLTDSFLVEAKDQNGKDRSLERLNADRHIFIEKITELIANAKKEENDKWQKIIYGEREMYERGKRDGAEEERERIKEAIEKERETWAKESIGDKALQSFENAFNKLT